ncbi:hypothetical protein IWQ57_004690 [Coemansia nantahalensis]|uniref:Uncharacterized protein n=1 Tax=Coemansia nantahalensis TaxID=2789366 RepID=A0ACC1JRH5_9FUNG|nr:hypothetical protein IWQ57_004690 [Coemansia nantahalensis]
MSSQLWGRNRRGIAAAVAVGLLGLVGYLAYDAYQEAAREEHDSDDSDDSDVPSIAEQQSSSSSSSSSASSEQAVLGPRRRLVVSARGIVVDSTDSGDRWSGQVRVRAGAAATVARLAARYEVFLVAVVVPGHGSEGQILAALEGAGIVGEQAPPLSAASDIGESVVWVSSADESSVPSGMSSQVSSILNESPGTLPRSHVLFCETEEGKVHLARHLLAADPPVPHAALGRGCAGYVDTNRDVVARLAPVLSRTVLVAPPPHISPGPLIDAGEVPGRETALAQPPAGAAHSASEVVGDIASSSLL